MGRFWVDKTSIGEDGVWVEFGVPSWEGGKSVDKKVKHRQFKGALEKVQISSMIFHKIKYLFYQPGIKSSTSIF